MLCIATSLQYLLDIDVCCVFALLPVPVPVPVQVMVAVADEFHVLFQFVASHKEKEGRQCVLE